jgi:hypothetical protein
MLDDAENLTQNNVISACMTERNAIERKTEQRDIQQDGTKGGKLTSTSGAGGAATLSLLCPIV